MVVQQWLIGKSLFEAILRRRLSEVEYFLAFHDQEGLSRGKSKKSSRNPDFFSTFTFWWNWYSDNPNISVDFKKMIISAIASWWTSFHWELAVTLRATLVPVPRWASQELPSNASTWTSWPPRYWYSHLPSLVPTYPASSLLPVVESQVTNLKHLTWQYYVYNSVSQMIFSFLTFNSTLCNVLDLWKHGFWAFDVLLKVWVLLTPVE